MLGDHSPRGLSLSLCCPCAPQASWAIPSSFPMGSLSLCPDIGAGGMSGDSATSTWMTTGTSLMVPGELSGRDVGSSGTMEPAPTLVQCHPSLKGRRRLIATTAVASVPLALLTGLYSGSQSGMLRLLISEAIFFLCPGLVTPMAVRSWGREGGQCCPAPAVPPSHRPRPHLRRHPADGGDVVASVDEVGRVELQLELAEPLVHGLRALRREGQMGRGSSRDGDLPLLPVSPKLSPHAPRSPSPLTAAPFSSAGARRGAGGRTGSWPRSATATSLPEGQRSAGLRPSARGIPQPQPRLAGPRQAQESETQPSTAAQSTPRCPGHGAAPRGGAGELLHPAQPPAVGLSQISPPEPSGGSQSPWRPGSSQRGPSAQKPLASLLRPCHQPRQARTSCSSLAPPHHGHPLVPTLQGKEGCPEIFASCF